MIKEVLFQRRINTMPNDTTTIEVKRKTKAKLDKIGNKNESYNDVIERLLK